ncbi:MAG: AAA family ATPase [Hydrogenovibrio sp.]|uniref:AAA family ATPase n=1 Tax=Hydrogenovibrio sp. TaxID=2065821 RepID=UPI00286FDE9D|nr:AAA family ATPase [Hydrogenovibrio sp.]MDR9498887.1 AAA family ATPase [Hydrogenovibrio sp.]
MDPRYNPFAPGAGTPPPELSGRDEILERSSIALHRIAAGRVARSLVLYGLRGVGKTVLLYKVRELAESEGYLPVVIEAPEERSLAAILGPALRTALIKMSKVKQTKEALGDVLQTAKGALASFVRAAKIKFDDIEVNIDFEAEEGLADSGDFERDLTDLLVSVGESAKSFGKPVVLVIDEMQYVPESQLASLITALHRANQRQLPITLVGAGLPQLLAQMGHAKSYAERLFEFVSIGALNHDAAIQAIRVPLEQESAEIEPAAIEEIIKQTRGYPYFVQEWGKHVWDIAQSSPIKLQDVVDASDVALSELDESFFRVRFDRLTPTEKRYMRAMAELGEGPHRSSDISDKLGKTASSVAPIRARLIQKGMIYSPSHGDTAFTVPLFGGFMKRVMPELT